MATYTSAATGLWSAGATWVGGVKPPSAAGHKIVIAATHVVTFDEAAGTYGDDTSTGITVNGTLKASRSASTALTCRGDLYIGVGGTLDYGTEADPVPSSYIAQIYINNSATPAHNKWGIRTEESSGDWSGFRLWGAAKTAATTLPSGAGASDTTVTVADATGWQVGDFLVFEPSVSQDSVNGTVRRAITGISGNDVTIGASLAYASQVGRRVINLTRNVKIRADAGNTYRSHISIRLRWTFAVANAVEIGPCEINVFGGSSSTWQFCGLNMQWGSGTLGTAVVKKIDGLVIHDVWSISGSAVVSIAPGGSAFLGFTNQRYNYEVKNLTVTAANGGSATQIQNGSSVTFRDLKAIGVGKVVSSGYSHGAVGLVYDGGFASGVISELYSSTGIGIAFRNMSIDWLLRINSSGATAWGSANMAYCTFGSGLNKGVYSSSQALNYAQGGYNPLLADNCVFKEWPLAIDRVASNSQFLKPESFFKVRNANNDPSEQRSWYNWGEQCRDESVAHRGTSSVRMDAWYSDLAASISRTAAVVVGQTITVIGYLRFNSTFGTATPPSVSISGLGITPATFTAPAVADTWHKFTLTVTNPQNYAGEFTISASGQSAADATGAYFWIDGVPFTDYVTSVRHYGYEFDGLAYRTVDPAITQATEATVAAYTEIDTLDKLYDRLNLWACENQGDAVFYSYAGPELDLGAFDLVVDAAAASAFAITGTTVTIKADELLAGSTFTSVITSGTIAFHNGAAAGATLVYVDGTGTSVPIIVGGVRNGTKVRVIRTDTSAELAIGTAGASGFAARVTWSTDLPIRADTVYCNGLDAEAEASALGTLTNAGALLTIVQVPCTIYEGNGIDGSAVTGLTLDAPNIEIDADEVDNAMTVQEIFAWYKNVMMTDAGIRTLFGGITPENAHKYRINVGVVPFKIDQKDAINSLVLSGGMLYRDDGTSIRLAGSGVIEFVVDDVYESSAAETSLAAIKRNTDLIPALL